VEPVTHAVPHFRLVVKSQVMLYKVQQNAVHISANSSRHSFIKVSYINFQENPSGGSRANIYVYIYIYIYPVAVYSTHLHTNNTQNTENGTCITIKKLEHT
jgi:Na+-transporting NADH:ubiquinone oxidoreductase subunit NqrA